MTNYEFRIVVVQDGEEVLVEPIPCDLMTTISSFHADNSRCTSFFKFAAQHPSAEVRQEIACKENIDEETCRTLSNDESVAVLKNLLRNRIFRDSANLETIRKIVAKDRDLADILAQDVEAYKMTETQGLAEYLASYPDPSVVLSLARNRRTPKKVLKDLLNHKDQQVVAMAKESLK